MTTTQIVIIAAILIFDIIGKSIRWVKEEPTGVTLIAYIMSCGISVYALYSFLNYFITIKTP